MKPMLLNAAVALLAPVSMGAHLVITEVMSSSATTHRGAPVLPGWDYWELSNYGEVGVDLTGYRFSDNAGGLAGADPSPFEGLVIHPGEALVFVQDPEPGPDEPAFDVELFRALWGLPAATRVVVYRKNGFSASGDEVWLWRPEQETAGAYTVVDQVVYGTATRGRSWTYDPEAGVFGALSVAGVDGGWVAEGSDDVGSPGLPPRPIPLGILVQPAGVVANPGDTVVLRVEFKGLPKPDCRWYFNGGPDPVGTGRELTLTGIEPHQAGRYRVVLDNGRSQVASDEATVALQLEPSPPRWVRDPADLDLYHGQSGVFRVLATGVPQPEYQWWRGGMAIDGATNSELEVIGVGFEDAGAYTVVASNPSGSITNTARLVVNRRPRLLITEVMSAPGEHMGPGVHEDWWELTNFEEYGVDLRGYRFDDGNDIAHPGLETAWVVPGPLFIGPGESIVFVENMEPAEFRRWWGDENLPKDLKIVTYRGAALNFSGPRGDVIWFWNPGATEDKDYLVGVEFVAADPGRTFAYDPVEGRLVGMRAGLSREGVLGAFRAAVGGDIGSPGYVDAPPLKLLGWVREGQGVRIRWRTVAGQRYRVWGAWRLDGGGWEPLTPGMTATGGSLSHWVADEPGEAVRFLRVEGLEAAP